MNSILKASPHDSASLAVVIVSQGGSGVDSNGFGVCSECPMPSASMGEPKLVGQKPIFYVNTGGTDG